MDESERCFYYKGYLLMCDPTPVKPAGFRANAAVCSYGTAEVEVFATSPDGVYLISEEAAVEYARDWAVAWVDTHLRTKT